MFGKKKKAAEEAAIAARLAEIEALKKEIAELNASIDRNRADARRYRTEARKAVEVARDYAGRAQLVEYKKRWVTEGVPEPKGTYSSHDAGEDAYLMYRAGSSREEFDAYLAALAAAGFTRYNDEEEGRAVFSFWYNDKAVISASFSDTDSTLRIVVDAREKTALVPKEPICDGTPGVTTLKLGLLGDALYDAVDCGMSYVLRSSDGTFFVFDGGWDTDAITEGLYNRLVELSEGRPIVISAWIFSHAHIDHIGAFYKFAKFYGDKVTLKRVIHNFPGKTRLTEMGDDFVARYVAALEETAAIYGSDVQIFKARTGQRYRFFDYEIFLLADYEDYPMPRPLRTFNDTTVVFRMTVAGQKIMFLGDASEKQNAILVARYGELLKSDVVQVAHHGYIGGTKEVYDAIDAPVVFWPAPWIQPKTGNARLSDPEWSPVTRQMIRDHAKKVYYQYEGTVILDLPLDLG